MSRYLTRRLEPQAVLIVLNPEKVAMCGMTTRSRR